MDITNQASEREMADRERALAVQRATRSAGPSCSHCQDCGEPIPAKRQQAMPGATLCVACQSRQEQRRRIRA
ncbi:MAG TPA: TraR/DksA family transcriptional regulator [Paucimonas sp.]|nr:TraR/DksA family transcriptional regulator [Paucimonas sp.]